MASEICERVRGSEAAELHGRPQSAGDLRPHAKTARVGRRLLRSDNSDEGWHKRREAVACDSLLESLLAHHPSHAPIALLMAKTLEPPEPVAAPVPVKAALNPVTTLVRSASRHSGFSIADIMSHHHRAPLARMRHIVMYLSYRLTTLSFPMIGRLLSDRDHTTVLHGVRKIERQIQVDECLADDVAAVRDIAIDADPALGALA